MNADFGGLPRHLFSSSLVGMRKAIAEFYRQIGVVLMCSVVDAAKKDKRRSGLKGPILLTITAICYSIMAIGVRIAGSHGIPVGEILVVRFGFGLAMVAAIHAFGVSKVRVNAPGLWIVRGITGGLAITLYYASLSAAGAAGTTLTNSALLGNSAFIYTPLFGALLIKERLRLKTVLAVAVALLGLYLVVNPDFGQIRTGDLYGLFGGMVGGLTLIAVRELRKSSASSVSIFFSLCLVGMAIGLVMMMVQKPVAINRSTLLILGGVGLSGAMGQLVMSYAFRFIRAGEGSIIIITTVIYSATAGILWFDDPFNLRIIIGMVVVIGSVFFVSMEAANSSSDRPAVRSADL